MRSDGHQPPPSPVCSYLLVEQVAGRTQLKVADEGVKLLQALEGPIAPVVVIGEGRDCLRGVLCVMRRAWTACAPF